MTVDEIKAITLKKRSEAQSRLSAEAKRLAASFRRNGATVVILFGSTAQGGASPSSDLDLAVVAPGVGRTSFPCRGAAFLTAAAPTVAVDLLVYSPEEWSAMKDRRFVREEIVAKGVRL